MFKKVIRNSHCEEFGALEKKHQNEFRDLFLLEGRSNILANEKKILTIVHILLKKLQNNDELLTVDHISLEKLTNLFF